LRKRAIGTMSQERYVARFHTEKAALARHYCNVFKFWRGCRCKRCRRERVCCGDQHACLKRRQNEVPRQIQWRARQQILASTPANAGPPERTAREFLPSGFYPERSSVAGG
jgi:hypothetical protein